MSETSTLPTLRSPMTPTNSDPLDVIESYQFGCEAGPLALCADWISLRASLESLHVVLDAGSVGAPHAILHTSGHGGWRTYVFTTRAEAEAARAAFQGDNRLPRDRFSVARLIDVLPLVLSPGAS